MFLPCYLSYFGESLCGTRPIRRCLALHRRSDDGDRNTKERWWEAEVNRMAGEIALKPEPDAAKAKAISSMRSQSRVNSKPNPGNSAPP